MKFTNRDCLMTRVWLEMDLQMDEQVSLGVGDTLYWLLDSEFTDEIYYSYSLLKLKIEQEIKR
jgi:hypothetical protein